VDELDLTDLDGAAWALIEGGTFLMGSDLGGEDTGPVHEVRVTSFRISRYPVTNAQYAEFVRETNMVAPAHWRDGEPPDGKSNHPVTHVTWDEAQAFCAWLSGRVGSGDEGAHLPTEAQWEFAARGVDGRQYPWGNRHPTPEHANYQGSALEDTSPVGSHVAGATPERVHELAGNVRQWCLDWYDQYASRPQSDPIGPEIGEGRSLRGGSYIDAPGTLRGVYRFAVDPGGRFSFVGFRVAWSSHGGKPT